MKAVGVKQLKARLSEYLRLVKSGSCIGFAVSAHSPSRNWPMRSGVSMRYGLRCDVWELTREVCDLARTLTPSKPLRALHALHLATFVVARRKIEGLEMVTTDRRLAEVSGLV